MGVGVEYGGLYKTRGWGSAEDWVAEIRSGKDVGISVHRR